MKASTDFLLYALDLAVSAITENRTDIPEQLWPKVTDLRAEIQKIKELDTF